MQAAALQAVRGALQRSQAGGVPSAAAAWAWDCAARALTAAAADVHGLMRGGNAAALSAGDVQVTCLLIVASGVRMQPWPFSACAL